MIEPVLFKQPDKSNDCLKFLLPKTMMWVLVLLSFRKCALVQSEMEDRQEGTSEKRVELEETKFSGALTNTKASLDALEELKSE